MRRHPFRMNKKVVISAAVLVIAIVALAWFLKSRGGGGEEGASSDEDKAVETVVNVRTGALARATLRQYVGGYGTVSPAPASSNAPPADATISSAVAGAVAQVNVIEGERVEKGEILAALNSSSTTFENAQREAERQKNLYEQHNTSLKALEDAQAQLALLQIPSPLSGTLVKLNVKPGQAVDATTVVAEVMDLDRLALNAQIPAAQAAQLRVGQTMEAQTDPPATARVFFVSPAVDRNNDTVLAAALLPPDSGLRPGQFVSLRVITGEHKDVLAAPAESVVTDSEGRQVIAIVSGEEAEQAPVTTGYRDQGLIEVTGANLHEGQIVVTVGAYGLPKKTKVQIVNDGKSE